MTVDPRQARTSAALRAALAGLLAQQPLDDISVAELCRAAGVHRTTFYRHADDVHRFAVTTLAGDLDALSDVTPASDDADAASRTYLNALRDTFALLAERRVVYRALFASSARGAFRSVLVDAQRHRAQLALDYFAESGVPGVPEAGRDRAEAAAFIAGALVGVMDVWTREDDTDADAAGVRVLALMPWWWPIRP